jgi:nicotinic acid mononucleotide adenylyltransferase
VTKAGLERIVDLRGNSNGAMVQKRSIFITNAVNLDISATEIRRKTRENEPAWRTEVPPEVANYIEKYQIYS